MGLFLSQLEHSGFATWIREGGTLYGYPLILFLHTLGLSTLVGLSWVISLRILGVGSGIPLPSLEKVFWFMWAGMALNALTGSLLFIADATKHASNPAFYVKLTAVAFGIWTLTRIRKRVFVERRTGRLLAAVSLGCWFIAMSAARLMAYISEFIA
jgi:hypothetical protein